MLASMRSKTSLRIFRRTDSQLQETMFLVVVMMMTVILTLKMQQVNSLFMTHHWKVQMSLYQSRRHWTLFSRLIRAHTSTSHLLKLKKKETRSLRLWAKLMNLSSVRQLAKMLMRSTNWLRRSSQLKHEIKEERDEEVLFGGRPDIFTEMLGLPVMPSLAEQTKRKR